MPRLVTLQVGAEVAARSIEPYHGETLELQITGLTPGALVRLDIARTALIDAEVSLSGSVTITAAPADLVALGESADYRYTLWEIQGADETVRAEGVFRLKGSVRPKPIERPVAAGALPDRTLVRDVPIEPFSVAGDFTGEAMAFALAPASAALFDGLSVSAAGEVSGTPSGAAAARVIVIRASNAGGFADSAFTLTLSAASGVIDSPDSFATYAATASADPAGAYVPQLDRAAYRASTGRRSTAPLRRPGVDPMPEGWSLASNVVTVEAPFSGDILDWDFSDQRLDVKVPVGRVAECVFADNLPKSALAYFGSNVSACIYVPSAGTGAIADVEDNTYTRAVGMPEGVGMFIQVKRGIAPDLRRNRIERLSGDFARPDRGGTWEDNDVTLSSTDGLLPYDPAAIYSAGDYLLGGGGHVFRVLTEGLTGADRAPPASKTSNADYQLLDAHSDFGQGISFAVDPAAPIVWRHNLFEFTEQSFAVKHFWIAATATGTVGDVLIENNLLIRPAGAGHAPISIDATGVDLGAVTIRGNFLAADQAGDYAGLVGVNPDWTGNRAWRADGTRAAGEIIAKPAIDGVVLRTMAVIGQSENVIGWLDNTTSTTSGPYPALLPGVDVEIAIPRTADSSGTDRIRPVTADAVTARELSPGAVAIANLWHLGSGGEALRLAGVCRSGTGMPELMDDDDPDRSFANEKALVDEAAAAWGRPIERVTYNWYVAEAGASQSLWESRAPEFFGINPDGSPYDFAAGPLEHCLIDSTGRGFGMFDEATRVDLMFPGNFWADNNTAYGQPNRNYTTDAGGLAFNGRQVQNAAPAYQERLDFLVDAPAINRGVATVSPALARMGDYTGGVQNPSPAQVGSHPSVQHKDGQILYSSDIAASLLISYGHAQATVLERVEVGAAAAYVDFIFALPAGAVLTTQRILDAETVASPRPHQQQVMGFVIQRAGGSERTERPLYRTDVTDATLYPADYRGTAVIHDAGTDYAGGVREGVVRVTPQQAFRDGDLIRFGDDGVYGAFNLHGHPDYDAHLYRDGLRAYEARLDDGSATRYPGLPVRNQVRHMMPVGTTPNFYVSKPAGNDAYVRGPDVGAGVVGMTMLFRGTIGAQGDQDFGAKTLFGLNSNGLTMSSDTRAGKRSITLRMEDGSGTQIFSASTALGTLPGATEEVTLMLTATQDDGTGTARLRLYKNGGLVADADLSAAATAAPTFQSSQWFEAFTNSLPITVGRFAVWDAFAADGLEPAVAPRADLQGNADFWNGTGLPAGWSKLGAGLWSDA